MKFGRIIASAREREGLNQRELAALILKEDGEPISPPYLNDIEHNRRTPSSDHMIEQFAEALDIHPELLYYAARKIPASAYKVKVGEDRVIAAFKAFQGVLLAEKKVN
jgi:transcriptional regulator with XRE-family HTH domain